MFKKLTSTLLVVGILATMSTNAFAAELETEDYFDTSNATIAEPQSQTEQHIMTRASQGKKYTIPGNKGTITSNAWRTSGNGSTSGNTRQWDYQVSAVYAGTKEVAKIRTTWQGSASMRNGASFSLGISDSGVTAGGGSSWQNVVTTSKYYENSNGSKTSSYRSNMIATPSKDYRSNTVSIKNEAKVTLKGDPKPYAINASA